MYHIWKWASLILIPNTLIAIYTMRWVIHTHEVKEQLVICVSDVRDAETSVRGFMASKGDEKFLEAYYKVLPKVDPNLQRLSELMQDNPVQMRKLPNLSRLTHEKLDVLAQGVNFIKKKDYESPTKFIRTGFPVMLEVRSLVREMNEEEDRLLSVRAEKSRQSLFWMTGSLVIIFVALIVQGSIDFYERITSKPPKPAI